MQTCLKNLFVQFSSPLVIYIGTIFLLFVPLVPALPSLLPALTPALRPSLCRVSRSTGQLVLLMPRFEWTRTSASLHLTKSPDSVPDATTPGRDCLVQALGVRQASFGFLTTTIGR